MNRVLVIGICAALLAAPGCGPAEQSGVEVIQPDDGPAERTADRTKAAGKVYRPPVHELIPEPDPIATMINNGAGVLNPDFNGQTTAPPEYWEVKGYMVIRNLGPDAGPALHVRTKNAGSEARQVLPFDESPAGNLITLKVMAHSNFPDLVTCRIELENGTVAESEPHPGDSKWHDLVTSVRVPDDYESDTVTIALIAKPAATQVRIGQEPTFDDVRLTVTK